MSLLFFPTLSLLPIGAIKCVIKFGCPCLLHVFAHTGINHNLEKSSSVCVVTGKLFDNYDRKTSIIRQADIKVRDVHVYS